MSRTILYGQTLGGAFVPLRVDSDGYAQTSEPFVDQNGYRKVTNYDANFRVSAITVPGIFSAYNESKIRLLGETSAGSTLDTEFWDSTVSGSGATATSAGQTSLTTGTTANSSAILRTKQTGRYLTGGCNVFLVGLRVGDTGTANNIRRWGAFDANNGFFFELNGTTLNAVCRNTGVDTKVASTSWNTSYTLDTNYHRYEIYWYGGTVLFVVDGNVCLTLSGNIDFVRSATLSLKMSYENINSGGSTSAVSMFIRGSSISRFGPEYSRPRYRNITAQGTTVIKTIPGTLHRIIINQKGQNNSTVALYDNTAGSGTLIATISTADSQGSLNYGVDFGTGLTIVASATPGNITIVFD